MDSKKTNYIKGIDVFNAIDKLVSKDLALKNDNIGYFGKKDLKYVKIERIKVMMDVYPEDDKNSKFRELFVTHHPPIFTPKTPTYTIHSNWDIIEGGANDALAKALNLELESVFDKKTGIGRICNCEMNFNRLISVIGDNLNLRNNNLSDGIDNIRIVNKPKEFSDIKKVAIVAGFGLRNLNYIKLAKEYGVDLFISGDLTLEGAILAKKLNISLLDVSHYSSEIPGLKCLANLLKSIGLPVELGKKGMPWEDLSLKYNSKFKYY